MNRTLSIVASAALAMATVTSPAAAGGWGKGPSWSEAKRIASQAETDVKNGVEAIAPAVLAVIVVIICVATDGACVITFADGRKETKAFADLTPDERKLVTMAR